MCDKFPPINMMLCLEPQWWDSCWTVWGHITSLSLPTSECFFSHPQSMSFSLPMVSGDNSMHYTSLTKVHADRWEKMVPPAKLKLTVKDMIINCSWLPQNKRRRINLKLEKQKCTRASHAALKVNPQSRSWTWLNYDNMQNESYNQSYTWQLAAATNAVMHSIGKL